MSSTDKNAAASTSTDSEMKDGPSEEAQPAALPQLNALEVWLFPFTRACLYSFSDDLYNRTMTSLKNLQQRVST